MNKKITLLGSIAASAIATISPITLSSCAKLNTQYDEITKEIKQQAIDEFVALSKVYRPSFQTRAICDYLKDRIHQIDPTIDIKEDLYRSTRVDKNKSSGNIWFDVPANDKSLEKNHELVIQGHMDMVCFAINEDELTKMKTNGVEPYVDLEHGFITSKDKKTSLGADDGIGLGIILAMLQNKNFKHGPLKYIITADEEEGMAGAGNFGLGMNEGQDILKDSYALINVDNELEGQIITSTAGGLGIQFDYEQPSDPITLSNSYSLTVNGLKGGHSGDMIGKGRANAIKIANHVLLRLLNTNRKLDIVSFTCPGTTATNAIPTTAEVKFVSDASSQEIQALINAEKASLANEYPVEDGINIKLENFELGSINKCYDTPKSKILVSFINLLIYGVVSWKRQDIQLPETSANIGPISVGWYLDEEEMVNHPFSIQTYARSCNNDHIEMFQTFYKGLAETMLGSSNRYHRQSLYYGWPGDEDQKFINHVKDAFTSFGIDWTTDDPHAGLEISWFKHFNPNLYITSIGPSILDVHTANETLYLNSVDSTIKVILSCIDFMKK